MVDKTHSRNTNELTISRITKVTLPSITGYFNKKKKLIIPKFKIYNRLVGRFIYPIEKLANNIQLPQTYPQEFSKTPKLSNQYTQKLSVLLNSNDKDYLAKRKRIDKLVISYCDNAIKLTDPNKEEIENKVRSVSFTSRNANAGVKNAVNWNISNSNKPTSYSFMKQVNKCNLDIPEFDDKEIDVNALSKEVKKGLEDYYQLNSIENKHKIHNNHNNNGNCDSANMIVLYNKAKQQHNVANRINSLMTNHTHIKMPNLSEISRVLSHNHSTSDLNSPTIRLKPYKVSFDYLKNQSTKEKSQIRLNDNKQMTSDHSNDQEEFKANMSLNKQPFALSPKKEVLSMMNKQNNDLSLLVDQCRKIKNIKNANKHLSHNIKIARSPRVNLSLKKLKLASVVNI